MVCGQGGRLVGLVVTGLAAMMLPPVEEMRGSCRVPWNKQHWPVRRRRRVAYQISNGALSTDGPCPIETPIWYTAWSEERYRRSRTSHEGPKSPTTYTPGSADRAGIGARVQGHRDGLLARWFGFWIEMRTRRLLLCIGARCVAFLRSSSRRRLRKGNASRTVTNQTSCPRLDP